MRRAMRFLAVWAVATVLVLVVAAAVPACRASTTGPLVERIPGVSLL